MPSAPKQPEKPCPNLALAPVLDHNAQWTTAQVIASLPIEILDELSVPAETPFTEAPVTPDTGPSELYLLHSILRV